MKMDAIICLDYQEGHRPVYKQQTTGASVIVLNGKIDSFTLSANLPNLKKHLNRFIKLNIIINGKSP